VHTEEVQNEEYIKSNLKRNFFANIFDGAFFSGGLGFISVTTILPYFVSRLTDSRLVVSMIMAVMMLGNSFPQLISANWAESIKYKKRAVLILGLLQRVPWLLLVIFTYFLGTINNTLLLVIFFICWAFYSVGSGLVVPVWFDMVAKVIPVTWRGRMFGYRGFIGTLLEVLGAFIASYIISEYIFPVSFTILFAFTFIALTISYSFLFFIKEKPSKKVKEKRNFKNYFKQLPEVLKDHINFRYYLIGLVLIEFIGMSNGLFTVAGIERLGLSSAEASGAVGLFTIIYIISQSLISVVWGSISDKYGHKIVIFFAACFNALGALTAVLASSLFWYYMVFVLTGIAMGANRVSFITIVVEFCSEQERPTYIGISNTVRGVTVTLVALFGGYLADIVNYELVFFISFVMISLGAYIIYFKVNEPRFDMENKGLETLKR